MTFFVNTFTNIVIPIDFFIHSSVQNLIIIMVYNEILLWMIEIWMILHWWFTINIEEDK